MDFTTFVNKQLNLILVPISTIYAKDCNCVSVKFIPPFYHLATLRLLVCAIETFGCCWKPPTNSTRHLTSSPVYN